MLSPVSHPKKSQNLRVVSRTPNTVAKWLMEVPVSPPRSLATGVENLFQNLQKKILGLVLTSSYWFREGHMTTLNQSITRARKMSGVPLLVRTGSCPYLAARDGSPHLKINYDKKSFQKKKTFCWCLWKGDMDAEQTNRTSTTVEHKCSLLQGSICYS